MGDAGGEVERARRDTARAVGVTVRHEINNALTSIIGNAELILRGAEGLDPILASRIEDILRQGRRIQSVLDRLEALTEVRTTTYRGGVEMVDIGEDPTNPSRKS
jgi:signal transduction histidine kinase